MRGRRDRSVICEGLVCIAHEKDVLWLEVGVDEVEVMKNWTLLASRPKKRSVEALTGYTRKKLSCKVLYLRAGKGHETVTLQKIEDALSQKICDDANVVAVVKAIA